MSVPWGRLGSSRVKRATSERIGWSAVCVSVTLVALRYGRREGLWAEPGAWLWTYLFDVVTMTAYLLSYVLRSNQGALVTGLRPTLKDLPQ